MDQINIYDVKAHHHGIQEILDLSRAGAPEDEIETSEMQRIAQKHWTQQLHPKYALAPEGWLPSPDADLVTHLSWMVDFSFEHVPMYRQIYSDAGFEKGSIRSLSDFEALPILTRRDLNAWDDDARLSQGRLASQTFFVGTSGSSGRSLKVFYDQLAAVTETYESLVQYRSYLGGVLRPDEWIYNIHMSRGWLSSLVGTHRTFTIAAPASPGAMMEHFFRLQPRILCALPSHLWELELVGDLSRFGIGAISTNSEQSSRSERDSFEAIFNVPVLDEYSSVELGVIAYEHRGGGYRVNRDGLLVELIDSDIDGFGRVVATDYRSWVMPLIRYDQGDLAAWADGLDGIEFREIRGRADDYFLSTEGRKIPSATLLNLVDVLFTSPESPLLEFRLVQLAPNRARLDYVLRPGEMILPSLMQTALQQRLNELMGPGSVVEFNPRQWLDSTPSYKRKKVLRAF